ncbi:MAG: sulfite exporter TauE/SafE family protein [Ignavibacteriae bacterium]|nr:sulfite exporter TauE/SafE family protein [Ignavibacteriota bacterium]NOG98531.1 sulfite exporter TauE/SafE family protein [Ignavibacteriota bacterium]
MPDITSIIILFAAGIVAGFINVMAGGGSTITLPILIFLGLDATVANGTNRIAIFIQNIAAIKSFKNEQYSEFKISFKMALFALPGAIIGALFAVRVSGELFEKILAIVMIGIIISMIVPKKKNNTENDAAQKTSWVVYLAMFGIGFYGGFIQVGVGFLLMAALQYLMRINLVLVNMHKVFIVLIYTFPALVIFIVTDNVNWQLGLALAAGNAFGGWWSAKIAVKKGEKLIKGVLIAAILIMSLKLLEVF